jgi:uncharacterized protein
VGQDADETGRPPGAGGGVATAPAGARAELVERSARVFLRPLGNPLPLGFVALAAATLVLSGLQLGWMPASETEQVALILAAFAFPLQLLTSVFGYLGRDVVVGTGMGICTRRWRWRSRTPNGETVLPLGRRGVGT